MNLRKAMYIVIAVVCIWSIAIGVYDQVNRKVNRREYVNDVVPSEPSKNTQDEPQSQADLRTQFDKIFNNEIITGQYDISTIKKVDEDKDIIYTFSAQRKKDEYELDINFPIINIENEAAEEIDEASKEIFIAKANSIIENPTEQTFYTISYAAYINGDILSIVIKSTLKEGNNAQRVMVQTYNINLTTGKQATLNDLLVTRQVNKDAVTEAINSSITEAIKEANSIQETGYEVYSRNLKNTIYNINNVDTFFLDKDGALCIVFAYGNYDNTSEMDIVKI